MELVQSKKDGLKRQYEIKIASAILKEKINSRLAEVAKQAKVDGFRPGKVPVNVVKKRFGKAVKDEVIEREANSSVLKLLKDEDITPATEPQIDIKEYEEGADLLIALSMDVYPEVPDIDLGNIKIHKYVAEVTPRELDKKLKELVEHVRDYKKIAKPRAVQDKDAVIIDYVGKIDGSEFEGGKAEDYKLVIGSKRFIDTFEEQLIGLKEGEEKLVKVKFPDNYGAKKFKGKKAEFNVKVKEILEPEELEIDDELAKKFGFENLDELKKDFATRQKEELDNLTKSVLRRELFDSLDKIVDFEVPESMVEQEYTSLMEYEKNNNNQEHTNDDDHVHDESCQHEHNVPDKNYKKLALRRVKLGIFLSDLAGKNKISASDEEIRNEVFKHAKMMPGNEQKIIEFYRENRQAQEALKGPIIEDKVVEFLLGKISIAEKKISTDELIKKYESD